MALLGVPPGPVVGEAYKYLLELRLENGPLGQEAASRRCGSGGRPSPP